MILNSVTYYIKNFDPLTDYSFTFDKLQNGHYSVVDRGESADVYRARITVYDNKDTLDNLNDYINSLRESDTVPVTFDTTEQVFGADVDYSAGYGVSIVSATGVPQKSFKGFEYSFTIEVQNPTLTGVDTFPELNHSEHDFEPEYVNTRSINYGYDGTIGLNDNNADHGIFKGTFYFNDIDMRNLRKYHRTKRGTSFYLNELPGFEYIFGRKRNITFPAHVRLLDFKESYDTVNRWKCKLRLVEEV